MICQIICNRWSFWFSNICHLECTSSVILILDSCGITIYRNILDTTISTMSPFDIGLQGCFFRACWIAQVIDCRFFSWIEICIFNCKTCMTKDKGRCITSIPSHIVYSDLSGHFLVSSPNEIFLHINNRFALQGVCLRGVLDCVTESTSCPTSPCR